MGGGGCIGKNFLFQNETRLGERKQTMNTDMKKLVKLRKQLVIAIENMQNSIATGPKRHGAREINSNKERLLVLKKYRQIRNKFYKQHKDLASVFASHNNLLVLSLNEPLVKMEQIFYKSDGSRNQWKKVGFREVEA